MTVAVSSESVRSWWVSLTPDKRKLVMGAGCVIVLLGVLYLFIAAGPDSHGSRINDKRADVNLLTGSDTRSLGLEAVGAELRDAQRKQREMQGKLDRLSQLASTKDDLKIVSDQLAVLNERLGALKQEDGSTGVEHAPPPEADSKGAKPSSNASSTGATADPQSAQRRGLFDDPDLASPSPPNTSRVGKEAAASSESIKVRVYGEGDSQAAKAAGPGTTSIYIPAGSIISGVLITGVDAPTGMQSKRDPIPALMRIKHDAILPNRFSSDVRECFVLLGATGDLSTERALMRAETLSCVRNDGGVIEVVLDAYAMGDDGKAGVRGRLVSRNGSLVAKAAFASFAEALSQIFRPVAIQGLNTSPGQRTEFQAPNAGEALEAAGYAGVGGAMRRLSEYFVDLADEIVPFVEIDAARQVEAVLLKGVTLQVRSDKV